MLAFAWVIAALALVTAVVALVAARLAARRARQLSDAYWQLRYEHSQLALRVARLDPRQDAGQEAGQQTAPARTVSAFVPLSSLRR